MCTVRFPHNFGTFWPRLLVSRATLRPSPRGCTGIFPWLCCCALSQTSREGFPPYDGRCPGGSHAGSCCQLKRELLHTLHIYASFESRNRMCHDTLHIVISRLLCTGSSQQKPVHVRSEIQHTWKVVSVKICCQQITETWPAHLMTRRRFKSNTGTISEFISSACNSSACNVSQPGLETASKKLSCISCSLISVT